METLSSAAINANIAIGSYRKSISKWQTGQHCNNTQSDTWWAGREHSPAALRSVRPLARHVPSAAPQPRAIGYEHRSTLDNMLHRQTDTTPILLFFVCVTFTYFHPL